MAQVQPFAVRRHPHRAQILYNQVRLEPRTHWGVGRVPGASSPFFVFQFAYISSMLSFTNISHIILDTPKQIEVMITSVPAQSPDVFASLLPDRRSLTSSTHCTRPHILHIRVLLIAWTWRISVLSAHRCLRTTSRLLQALRAFCSRLQFLRIATSHLQRNWRSNVNKRNHIRAW